MLTTITMSSEVMAIQKLITSCPASTQDGGTGVVESREHPRITDAAVMYRTGRAGLMGHAGKGVTVAG